MRSSWPPACNGRSPPGTSHGGEGRIRAARFPARKSLEEFDFDHARGLKRDLIAHLGTLDFVTAKDNVLLPRARPAPARPTSRPGWRSGPAKPGTGCCSRPPPSGSPASPTPTTPAGCKTSCAASAATRCSSSTKSATSPSNPKPRTCSSSSSPPATNARRLIVTSNKPFGRWGEVFGDDVVAAAMIDRLVHHAEVLALKGDSYRLKDRDLGRDHTAPRPTTDHRRGSIFTRR